MIRYTDLLEGVSAEMLEGFFDGWTKPRTPAEHMKILEGSDHIVLAVDADSGRVVGFVTALTDGIQAAFIPLLEILPTYRHRGIGTALVTRMLEKLKGIPAIDLTCDPELQRFYTRFGMTPSVGMAIRDY